MKDRTGGHMAPTSYEIGKAHAMRLGELFDSWKVTYVRKKKFRTVHGRVLEVDFWLPPTETRGAVVIECKDFGVSAKSLSDSRRRKEQEALWLLVQIRRYCSDAKHSRIDLPMTSTMR